MTEHLNDHHNGGCAELPLVVGAKNDIPTGESLFRNLPEAEQKQRMGADKWQAWQDGKFEFGQLAGTHTDDVYGDMRTTTSLKDLLGGNSSVSIEPLGSPLSSSQNWTAFDTRSDADEWGFGSDGINPTLTKAEETAVTDYKSGGTYRDINQYLRTGKSDDDWMPEIGTIDSALEKSRLSENVSLYRGVSADAFPTENMTGSSFLDKGYLSTSVARETGEKFARWAGEDGGAMGLVIIDAPKGTPALWLENFWKTSGESELLLPRNTELRVVSDAIKDGVRILRTEVVR